MIRAIRTSKPTILVQNATNWSVEYIKAKQNYEISKSSADKKIFQSIEKRYNHSEVKTALKAMFHKKCAFCESHITHVDYGQIEHFKPKSKYPELCFEWDNFLLSCAICNGKSNKGDKFPLAHEDGPFVNPVDEEPNDFFKFEYDTTTKMFLLFPKNKRAMTTIKILGLNRDDLAEFRTKELLKIIDYLEILLDQGLDEPLEEFIKLFSEKDQYYAFLKVIFEKVKTT